MADRTELLEQRGEQDQAPDLRRPLSMPQIHNALGGKESTGSFILQGGLLDGSLRSQVETSRRSNTWRVKSRPSQSSATQLCMAADILCSALTSLSRKGSSGSLPPSRHPSYGQVPDYLPTGPNSAHVQRSTPMSMMHRPESLLDNLFTHDDDDDYEAGDIGVGMLDMCPALISEPCASTGTATTILASTRSAASCSQVPEVHGPRSSTQRSQLLLPTRLTANKDGPTSVDSIRARQNRTSQPELGARYSPSSRTSINGTSANPDRLIALMRALS